MATSLKSKSKGNKANQPYYKASIEIDKKGVIMFIIACLQLLLCAGLCLFQDLFKLKKRSLKYNETTKEEVDFKRFMYSFNNYVDEKAKHEKFKDRRRNKQWEQHLAMLHSKSRKKDPQNEDPEVELAPKNEIEKI